jgi:hypothetical protein
MVVADDIPQWALERAAERVMAEPGKGGHYDVHGIAAYDAGRAFARYIAEHEEPPVDPLLVEAREVAAQWFESMRQGRSEQSELTRRGEDDNSFWVQIALAALERGMELARAQDGSGQS